MTSSLSPFSIESDAWVIDLSEDDRQAAWSHSEPLLSPKGRWQTYLGTLSQQALQALLEEGLTEAVSAALPKITPYENSTFSEFVPGAALDLGNLRLVMVPTEALEVDSLEIPQEWIDLPSWHGDYYVAVQFSPQEEQLRILGYATHQQIKTAADFDAFDRTYSLDRSALIPWDLFESTYDRYSPAQTRSLLAPLEPLAVENAAAIIKRLADPTLVLPRLEVPFGQWGAILESQPLRRQLYQTRRGDVPALTRLSDWLQEQIDSAWHSLETLLPQQPLALARSAPAIRDSPEADEMLCRAKQLSLGIQEDLALVVGVAAVEGDEVRILLKLESTREVALPHEVRLRLLSAEGDEIGQATAVTTERLQIQFRASAGERFAVEVSSQGQQATEYFSV